MTGVQTCALPICLLIRTSENVAELLDLYDAYMDQAEEKRKAAGEQLSFADMLGGENSAG